jgi:hypothetical protein
MQTLLTTQQIDEKILRLKHQLLALGPLHPGSLSRQYQVCGKPGCKCCHPKKPRPHGPYTKLTYVYHGKFTCRFVRAQSVREVTALVANFKIFRQLTDDWVALSIQRAQLGALQRALPPSKKDTASPQAQKPSRTPKKGR